MKRELDARGEQKDSKCRNTWFAGKWSTSQPSKRSISSEQSPAERSRAVNYGGIGAIHLMGQIGVAKEINARVELLKRHLPYQESDHVLSLVYNALLDGLRGPAPWRAARLRYVAWQKGTNEAGTDVLRN